MARPERSEGRDLLRARNAHFDISSPIVDAALWRTVELTKPPPINLISGTPRSAAPVHRFVIWLSGVTDYFESHQSASLHLDTQLVSLGRR